MCQDLSIFLIFDSKIDFEMLTSRCLVWKERGKWIRKLETSPGSWGRVSRRMADIHRDIYLVIIDSLAGLSRVCFVHCRIPAMLAPMNRHHSTELIAHPHCFLLCLSFLVSSNWEISFPSYAIFFFNSP